MIRIALVILVSALIALPCRAFFEHAGDKDLAELKKTKGVFIATREGEWAQDFFVHSRNKNLVVFTIGWLAENDLLGKGYIEKLRAEIPKPVGEPFPLTEVELYGTDATGRTVFVTPLRFQEVSGGELTEQLGGTTHTRIEFSIDKSLLERSFLRFYEYVGHGKQWTDVYLGRKPAPHQQAPTDSSSPAPVIPDLELPSAK